MNTSNPVMTFPAVKGMQAGQEYFAAQVPYKALVRIFKFDEETLPVKLRAQRVLNEKRAQKIRDYILENRNTYILPALTASVDGEMSFETMGDSNVLGTLSIDLDANMLINDGQHRRSGIGFAIEEDPRLANETMTVTMRYDKGLQNSQQMFSDINSNQVKPSSSINMLYDLRNPFNRWLMGALDRMPSIMNRIDCENSTVAKNSSKLWTLIGFSKFVSLFTGLTSSNFNNATTKVDLNALQDVLVNFFNSLEENLPLWKAMLKHNISAPEIREQYILSHTVFLHALGKAAKHMLNNDINFTNLAKLADLDTSKTNPTWDGLCIVKGKMLKNTHGVDSTAEYLIRVIG